MWLRSSTESWIHGQKNEFWLYYAGSAEYDDLLQDLLEHNVPELTVQQAFRHQEDFIFLDARTKEEYNVSHIQDAIFIGYNDFSLAHASHLKKENYIIVYCSVGYRSEKICQELILDGYTNVANLYGGIFEWVNQDKPIVNAKGITRNIHPYDDRWGKWVINGTKAYK